MKPNSYQRSLLSLTMTILALSLILPVQGFSDIARITISARVNGQVVTLAVDTKSDGSTLFAHAADRLPLKWSAPQQTTNLAPGRVPAGKTELCKLDLGNGGTDFIFNVVAVPQYQRINIDGVISWNALKNNILMFDGELRQFSALETIPEFAANWQTFQIDSASPELIINANGKRISIYSSSDSGVRLPEEPWKQFIGAHSQNSYTLEAYSTPRNPVTVSEVFGAKNYQIGGISLENVFMGKSTTIGGSNFDAELGMQALSRLILIIDGFNSTCYIANAEGEMTYPDYNRLGAVFAPKDIRTSNSLIAYVAKGSPAEKAGIQANDELLKVDDLDVTQWRTTPGILPLGRFWRQPTGTQFTLSLLRNGEPLEVKVELDSILEK